VVDKEAWVDKEDPDARVDYGAAVTDPVQADKTLKVKKPFLSPVTATIQHIKTKIDKSRNNYLLLTLTEQENNVFVFPFRLAESR
jgi:hypothetical protein